MFLTLFLFFLSAAVIYFACEFFVNGVEWVGHRFQLGATATGTVLAAFGTALPESAVTFMAGVFGGVTRLRKFCHDTPAVGDIAQGHHTTHLPPSAIEQRSDIMANEGGDTPAAITQLTAESMKMSFLSQSSHTSLDSVSKALETMARKS